MSVNDRWGDGAQSQKRLSVKRPIRRSMTRVLWVAGLIMAVFVGHKLEVYTQALFKELPLRATKFLTATFDPSLDLVIAWPQVEAEKRTVTLVVESTIRAGNSITVMAHESQMQELEIRFAKAIQQESIALETQTIEFENVRSIMPFVVIDSRGELQIISPKTKEKKHQQSLVDSISTNLPGVEQLESDVETHRFITNGNGLFLTTYEADSLEFHEQFVMLGATQVIPLIPLNGEDSLRIGLFAQFVSRDLLVVGSYSDNQDLINAQILNENMDRLANVETASGPLRIVRVPMPDHSNAEWPSHLEIVFANRMIFVPTFETNNADSTEEILETYRMVLPGWEVIGVPSDDLVSRKTSIRQITAKRPRSLSPH